MTRKEVIRENNGDIEEKRRGSESDCTCTSSICLECNYSPATRHWWCFGIGSAWRQRRSFPLYNDRGSLLWWDMSRHHSQSFPFPSCGQSRWWITIACHDFIQQTRPGFCLGWWRRRWWGFYKLILFHWFLFRWFPVTWLDWWEQCWFDVLRCCCAVFSVAFLEVKYVRTQRNNKKSQRTRSILIIKTKTFLGKLMN